MLVSPTEPARLRKLGTVSPLPENYGADFLVVAHGQRTGIQRKQFPADFTASLADGRLTEQLHQMQTLDRRLLIVEGYGIWTEDGALVDTYRRFTRQQFYSTVWSAAFQFDIEVFQVRDINETIQVLQSIETWANKPKHVSLLRRPGPKRASWGTVSNKDYSIHLLQSFPGVGVELAKRIVDRFGKAPIRWEIDVDELTKVAGIGKKKAERILGVLNGPATSEKSGS